MSAAPRRLGAFALAPIALLFTATSLSPGERVSVDKPIADDSPIVEVVEAAPDAETDPTPDVTEPSPEVEAEPAPEVEAEPTPEVDSDPAPEVTDPAPEVEAEPTPEVTTPRAPAPGVAELQAGPRMIAARDIAAD